MQTLPIWARTPNEAPATRLARTQSAFGANLLSRAALQGVALASVTSASALLVPVAHAQDSPELSQESPPGDAPGIGVSAERDTSGLDERLRALEASSREREGALEAAQARIDALEARTAEAEARASAAEATSPSGPNVRPLASMVTRFEHREGYDALRSPRAAATAGCYGGAGASPSLADSDCVRYRARVGFEIAPIALGEDVTATIRFLPQVSGFWAMSGLSFGGPGGLGASSSGGTVDAMLGLHEGSLALSFGTMARLEVGRFEMSYGEHVVIGTLDWHPNGRAFDGARLRLTPEADAYYVDAFFTLVNEGHALSLTGAPASAGFGQADQSFYGLYAGLGKLIDAEPGTALDVYGLFLQTNNRMDAAAATEREWSLRATLGARFRHRFDLVDVRAEGAFQTGREGGLRTGTDSFDDARLVLAGFVIGEVGLNLLDDHFRVALEGNFASGNSTPDCSGCTDDVEEGYAALYPTAHAFLGYTDLMGARSNISSGVLHLAYKPLDELSLALDWHAFYIPERPANVGSNFAGQEADLNILWTPLPGLRARAMYGIYLPNTGYFRQMGASDFATDPAHYLEVELAYVLR